MSDPSKNIETFELLEFVTELSSDSDRGLVILGVAHADDALRRILERFLHPPTDRKKDELFDGETPLSTFSAKIKLAYRLRLIDKTMERVLQILRRMRNDFAHGRSNGNLSDPPQSDQLRELCLAFSNPSWQVNRPVAFPIPLAACRGQFIHVMGLVLRLLTDTANGVYLPVGECQDETMLEVLAQRHKEAIRKLFIAELSAHPDEYLQNFDNISRRNRND